MSNFPKYNLHQIRSRLQKRVSDQTPIISHASAPQILSNKRNPFALTTTSRSQGGRRRMPDAVPARLPGVPCWRREIYGNAVLATTNEQRRAVCPQSAERTKPSAAAHLHTALRAANILPCAVRLWSEHAFHRSPAASAEHPAAWQGLRPACAGVPLTPPNIQVC